MVNAKRLEEKHIREIKRYRRKALTTLVRKAYLLHRKGQNSQMNNLICEEFTKLGGVYVKFLQGVLLKSSMMRDWQSADRLKIFENLESEPIDIQVILRNELTAKNLKRITAISPTPFAAGSFGQVYFATLDDGSQIIVKLLRPLVRETLGYDLKLIGLFSRALVNRIYKNVDINILSAINDFKRATMRETDYVEEARFANELYQAYKDRKDFIIPKTYLDLCTKNLIVQEYVDGISVAQLLGLKEQGVNPEEYVAQQLGSDLIQQLRLVGTEYIKGIFLLPRVQGDPHPGNVKLLSNNRVALIDFGISARAPKERPAFYGVLRQYERVLRGDIDIPMLLGQFLRFFVSDLYKALKKITGLLPANDTTNDLTRQIGLVAESNFKKEMGENDLTALIENGSILGTINQVVNKGNRFGIVIKLDDSEMIRAAQSYMTLVEVLGLRTQVLPQAFDEGLSYVANVRPEYTQETEPTMSVNRAMEIISRWLERVAVKDPGLFRTFIDKINQAQTTAKPKIKLPAPPPKPLTKDDGQTGNA